MQNQGCTGRSKVSARPTLQGLAIMQKHGTCAALLDGGLRLVKNEGPGRNTAIVQEYHKRIGRREKREAKEKRQERKERKTFNGAKKRTKETLHGAKKKKLDGAKKKKPSTARGTVASLLDGGSRLV